MQSVLLPILVMTFFLGGGIVLFLSKNFVRPLVILLSLAALGAGVASIPYFGKDAGAEFSFEFLVPWISSLGAQIHFGVDGISYPLFLLTLFLGLVVSLLPYPQHHNTEQERLYWAILLWLVGGVIGVFTSLDLLLFYVFWEIVLILMFFLIALYGGDNRRYASMKFLLYTQFASLVMLLAIIGLYLAAGSQSFDIPFLSRAHFPEAFAMMTTLAFLFSFLVKIPAVPFHTWLPDAHVEAPTAGSVLLAGLLLKMGAYAILRIPFSILPDAMLSIAYPLGIFAFFTILYGAFVSLAQDNLKRMIAYSSVNHMGYVLLGIAAANPLGIKGSVYEMVAHGLGAGLLFAVAGFIHDKRGTFSITELKGLMSSMPRISWFFILGALAAMGLPTLAGFVAEFTIFLGAFEVYGAWILIPLTAIVVTAGYFIWTVQRSFWGGPQAPAPVSEPRTLGTWVPYVLLAAGLFFLGLWPPFLFELIEKTSFFALLP